MIGKWQDQYRRMHRSYAKVIGEHQSTDAYADDLYHFFMDCWHLKDWLRHDPAVPEDLRASVKEAAEADDTLNIAAELANGVKHFKSNRHNRKHERKRSGAEIVGNDVTIALGPKIAVTMKHRVKNDAGAEFVAEDIALQALEAWSKILTMHGLNS